MDDLIFIFLQANGTVDKKIVLLTLITSSTTVQIHMRIYIYFVYVMKNENVLTWIGKSTTI